MSVSLIDGHIDRENQTMTDNEIIKALEDLIKNFDGKAVDFMTIAFALDFINRQKEQIEALIASQETLQKELNEKIAEVEKMNNNISAMAVTMSNSAKATRTEAVKEFAEKVKGLFNPDIAYDISREIDNLVKEMVDEG